MTPLTPKSSAGVVVTGDPIPKTRLNGLQLKSLLLTPQPPPLPLKLPMVRRARKERQQRQLGKQAVRLQSTPPPPKPLTTRVSLPSSPPPFHPPPPTTPPSLSELQEAQWHQDCNRRKQTGKKRFAFVMLGTPHAFPIPRETFLIISCRASA